ncbi:MAG TPA: gamma-glutamyltransferase [Chloroflexota bacterium]|nr:gamma-glutamyltransferase [Chloroflexota bacterium]
MVFSTMTAGSLGAALRPEHTTRSATYASDGIVASASSQAAIVGVDVLRRGGNAFDAAIAVALVEGVTLPASCGLGGDAFMVAYEARSGRLWAVNGSGRSPSAVTRDFFIERGFSGMPVSGVHSVGLPGAVGAYAAVLERFGSWRFADLAQPAIDLAERGFALQPRLAAMIASARPKLALDAASAATFLPGGSPPPAGHRLRRTDLGRTLRHLVEHGTDGFYRGRLAERIVEALRELGSLYKTEDFAQHETDVYEPLATSYRGYTVHQTGLPSQGLIVLEILNLLELENLAELDPVEALHDMIEAKKLAFADRLAYTGDPRFVDAPVDRLISKAFAARRRAALDHARASEHVPGAPTEQLDGDTTSFVVVDRDGNAVSFIHSNSAGFGSGVTAGDTGILLNNRVGRGFSLVEGHPNVLAGGKRTMHTLNCYLVTRDGRPVIVGGTPGGDQQPQWNVQSLTSLIDFGLDVQEVAEMPRWHSYPSTDPEHVGHPFVVRAEDRFPDGLLDGLRSKGHRTEKMPSIDGGAIQIIQIDHERGVLLGGSDPRADGLALGW